MTLNKPDLCKKRNLSPRPTVLTVLVILGIAVLGALSLRQHWQLRRLRMNYIQARTRSTGLLNQLVGLRQQVESRLANNINSTRPLLPFAAEHITDTHLRPEQIIADAAPAVCLIQGEYMFVDPATEKPLRYLEDDPHATAGSDTDHPGYPDISDYSDLAAAGISGTGDPLIIQYTGTGFLADSHGHIITNKHVTAPWQVSRDYRHVIAAGYEPRLCLLRGFFSGLSQPFDLRVVAKAVHEDVALLITDLAGIEIEPLTCETDANRLKTGQTVIILGYPTGFDALLARLTATDLAQIVGPDGMSFEQVGLNLAKRRLIEPIGTRGMCSRVSSSRIMYDAGTAIGASGAPVLGNNGRVVAINTALLRGFSGTNFGIPIAAGMELLQQASPSSGPDVIDLVAADSTTIGTAAADPACRNSR